MCAKKRSVKKSNGKAEVVTISAPNLVTISLLIRGNSPYVQNKFSQKAKEQMKRKQVEGGTYKPDKGKPKDFMACYEDAQYKPDKGSWPNGAIPATAFKASMVAACRLVDGFKMTEAKQCVYVEADGYDRDEGIPLVKITKGKPKYFEQALRVANGNPDIRPRPKWDEGWEAKVRITYDADRFTKSDVCNLLMRAGAQVGIGEGRQASRMCVGVGWGSFKIVNR